MIFFLLLAVSMCTTSDTMSDDELSHDQPLAVSYMQDSSGNADISASSTEDFLVSKSGVTDEAEDYVEKSDKLGRVSKGGKLHIATHVVKFNILRIQGIPRTAAEAQ